MDYPGTPLDERNIRWSNTPYAGEVAPPPRDESSAPQWPTFFLRHNSRGDFTNPFGEPVRWAIENPVNIDFQRQLEMVQEALRKLTPEQIAMAEFWNAGPPTKQWTVIIDRLIDTYGVSATRSARILGAVQGAINDTLLRVWSFKYQWDIPRPNQLDQNLTTICCTPNHPSYPAGHGAVAGCAEKVLSYFFPAESPRLKALAEECAKSRLYAGVHYPVDNDQGLRLGRQIGRMVADYLKDQTLLNGYPVDVPYIKNLHAQLPPPPYRQAISFHRDRKCASKLDSRNDPIARS